MSRAISRAGQIAISCRAEQTPPTFHRCRSCPQSTVPMSWRAASHRTTPNVAWRYWTVSGFGSKGCERSRATSNALAPMNSDIRYAFCFRCLPKRPATERLLAGEHQAYSASQITCLRASATLARVITLTGACVVRNTKSYASKLSRWGRQACLRECREACQRGTNSSLTMGLPFLEPFLSCG